MPRRRLLQLLPLRPRLLCASPTLHPPTLISTPNAARFYRVSSSDDSSKGRRSSNNKSLSQLVHALRTFHSLEQHFAVPFSFVVPRSHDWPKELHQLPLGVKVHRFMQSLSKGSASALATKKQGAEQMQELRDMGFPLHSWQEYQFQEVCLPALRTYQEQYGDLFVPQKFIVPEEQDDDDAELWPRATRRYKLGLAVAKLRKQVQQQRQREQQLKDKKKLNTAAASAALPPLPRNQVDALNELGFVWRVRDTKWYRFFLPGLRKYKELHGNADVPLAFTIPKHEQDSRWPKTLEGYMLGRHVYMVRSGKYATQVRDSREELEALGFSFRLVDKVWSESIFPALGVFSAQYGHCDVWQDFVVPSEDPWPTDSWGLKLGDTVKNIRRGAYDSQVQAARKELDALGFVWNARHRVEKTVRSVVIPALATYRRLHGNDALVTTDFVVPDRDPNWPVLTRGFRLGQWITRVRSGQVVLSSKLRAELDKVGFVWRSNDQRWNEVLLPAFRAYAELHGGTCASMSTKFSVPPETPYPRAAWGVNLGGALWHIRNGDSYVNCEDKQRELRALGILADDAVA
ncbi:uncharacterized protein PITG_20331 [Phytophthora infestans T30-4]|uniref:Helicase-associated domain-containing protein n=2 Tax=Phytophthora infestans TaxID=4787 RepID=D0P218_PHYIT|nr:uncharacterized protein PITG_20331 [Phytophthora infestans T30-4]EEY55164.1 conserved hypothetical protein [Phytophthora infestans T30-4]KAF4148281.1 hypothetical protein GN958_ATG02524 [Phytophthora infestans]|eukprot:XP_002895663.1 conserved hypothetical protein [Phytophthora infestans T30-4]